MPTGDPIDYDAIAKQHGGVQTPQLLPRPAAPQGKQQIDYDAIARQHGGQAAEPAGPIERFFSSVWNAINPIPAVKEYLDRPHQIGDLSRAADVALRVQREKRQPTPEEQAIIDRGMQAHVNLPGGTVVPPMTEPVFGATGQAMQGDLAGAAGTLVGAYGVPAGVAAGVSKIRSIPVVPKVFKRNPNEVEAQAAEAGIRAGVDVDLATATGNQSVSGMQQATDFSPLGSFVAQARRQKQAQQLTSWGQRVADDVHGAAVVPEQAGKGIQSGLANKIHELKQTEDAAYARFRESEALPQNSKPVQVASETPMAVGEQLDQLAIGQTGKRFKSLSLEGQQQITDIARRMGVDVDVKPVVQNMALPVDMRPIKTALKPLYDDMKSWIEPARRNASAGLTAVKSIIEGPDFMPASQAEKGLGGLKSLAREAKSPDLADVNAGVGKRATTLLQDAIDKAVAEAGPDALGALDAGRKAHAAKMAVSEVLDDVLNEPVQAFRQATWAKDAGIEHLRAVARLIPDEMPKIGRAFLDELFTKATREGGFGKAQSVWNEWKNLGPETKQIIFRNAQQISELDNLFLLAKKMAERPNPSGSAVVGALLAAGQYAIRNPLKGTVVLVGGAPLAKMFYSPAAVRALTNGLKVPLGNKAAAAIAAGQVLKLAGSGAKELPGVPDSINLSQQEGSGVRMPGQQ